MAFLTYEGVGITAMAAAVPRCVVDNYKYTQYFPEDQVKEVVDKIGIYERRFADADTCSSDLCFAAAERLIEDNGINKEEIDLLVFISQTPDYRQPSTAPSLQDRLGLPKTVMAFDINMACSGYVYGLSLAKGLIAGGIAKNVLLLTAETYTKHLHPRDKGNRTDRRTDTEYKQNIENV